MAVQQNKVSSSRRDMRRAHDALRAVNLIECSHCKQAVPPHCICDHCGHYRGKKIIDKEAEE